MSHIYDALRRSEPDKEFVFPQVSEDAFAANSVQTAALDWSSVKPLRPTTGLPGRFSVLADPSSLSSEKFRALAARLRHFQADHPLRKLLITSTGPAEGKSFVSGNLALALAFVRRQKVLLIEGDLRKPSLMRSFGLPGLPGIIEHLQGTDPIDHFVYQLQDPVLYVLPAGGKTETPLDSLNSSRLDDCLRQLSGWFDWIIIDSTPLLPIADANLWAQRSDGILLVVREGKSSTRDLKKALDGIDNNNIVAVVLNDCSRTTRKYAYHYHY